MSHGAFSPLRHLIYHLIVSFWATGDHAVKAVGVIPEPEVKIFDLTPSDQFMIMASDGVWEFISSQVHNLGGVDSLCSVVGFHWLSLVGETF